METPRTVDEFYADVTRLALKDTASAQDAYRRWLGGVSEMNRSYLASVLAAQQAGLRATFDLQSAVIQASLAAVNSTIMANRELLDSWAIALEHGQSAAATLADAAPTPAVPRARLTAANGVPSKA